MDNNICFTVGYENIELELGLNDSSASKIIMPIIKTVETEVFSKSLENLINNVTLALENCSIKSNQYMLGDVELSLTISANGEVSILSAIQAAAGAEAAINVTLKRKE